MTSSLVRSSEELDQLGHRFELASPETILSWAWSEFGLECATGTSFQAAGLAIVHHCVLAGLPIPVFTIDTGLLFPETLELKTRLEDFWKIEIEVLTPELSLTQQEAELGSELWTRKPDLCCTLRKVLPLEKKLGQLEAWVTGLRRDQSVDRRNTKIIERYEYDKLRARRIVKVNPLANWSREEVWAYIREHAIPFNPLHNRGFRSIGCRPCTRPVVSGEDDRAGRWTGFAKTECGIHTFLGENI
jgi:phosphoadenosine phosphosulfate reductase